MTEVKLEGVNEVNLALQLAQAKISEIVAKTVEEVCKAGAEEAKRQLDELDAVDTGALRHSVQGDLVKVRIDLVEGQIGAGNETVIRGEGNFTIRKKTNTPPDVIEPTYAYAEHVEEGKGLSASKGPRRFMGNTYQYLRSLFPRVLTKAVQSAIKRIGR